MSASSRCWCMTCQPTRSPLRGLGQVNFSPSLNCDAPLDHRIKSGLVADLLTLVGIEAFDTAKAEWEARKRQQAAFHSRGSKFTRSRSSRGRKKAKKPPPQRGGDNFFDVLDPGAGRLTYVCSRGGFAWRRVVLFMVLLCPCCCVRVPAHAWVVQISA